jgi:hypothetical protein
MPDSILFPVILAISTLSILFGLLCFYFAYRAALKFTSEIAMVIWACCGLGGIVFGAMCWGYFLIPIIRNHI